MGTKPSRSGHLPINGLSLGNGIRRHDNDVTAGLAASPRAEPRSPTRSLTVRPATSPALNRVRSSTSGLSWPRPGRVGTAAFRESTKCGEAQRRNVTYVYRAPTE